ncbi:MAG: DUF3795 domain-containing protein [Eubacteriaceae bacterium]
MIESRCGLLCSKCKFRDVYTCPTCINTDKLYWGECEIKKCCESKNLTHCGECDEFPCSLLLEFSFNKEHGDNGSRIERCKKWAE